jgi:hypothetical protein
MTSKAVVIDLSGVSDVVDEHIIAQVTLRGRAWIGLGSIKNGHAEKSEQDYVTRQQRQERLRC